MQKNNHKGGPGPWFCALYFNLAITKGTKKQTDLRVHTYPLLFERIMNWPKAGSVGGRGWVIIMMVGHFDSWKDAIAYHTLWASQTRGKYRRIQRGIDLFKAYTVKYNLQMWIQPFEREQAILAWKQAYKAKVKAKMDTRKKIDMMFADKSLLLNTIHQTQTRRKKK